MDCADHCICGDGHRDGLECNLVCGVLNKKSVLEIELQNAFLLVYRMNVLLMNMVLYDDVSDVFHRLHSLTLPLTERVRSFHLSVS